ncbi:hypothetical protein VTO73DRAFT_2372 [Trametes versicolor]
MIHMRVRAWRESFDETHAVLFAQANVAPANSCIVPREMEPGQRRCHVHVLWMFRSSQLADTRRLDADALHWPQRKLRLGPSGRLVGRSHCAPQTSPDDIPSPLELYEKVDTILGGIV